MANKERIILFKSLLLATLYGFFPSLGGAADWPHWRGPTRDGVSPDAGVLDAWPQEGPTVLWRTPLGEGFSSITVSQGQLFTMFAAGDDEFVVSLRASDGGEVWRLRADASFTESRGNGPRSTPTVDGDRVYAVSANGRLYALDKKDGRQIWTIDLKERFGSKIPSWGYAASPLIEGNLLLLPVGGTEGNAIAALDKQSGETIWTAYSDGLSYSSPIPVTFNDVRQILFLTEKNLISVAPADGQIYWTYPWKDTINITTPILIPDDRIYISAAYDKGAAMLAMQMAQDSVGIEELWQSRGMKNWINSSILYENHLYGFDSSIFKCIDVDSGEEKWKTRGFERGSLVLAGNHLIVLGEGGELALVEATPLEYREKELVQILEGKCWTSPTLVDGRLYLRNEEELLCLDLQVE